MDSTKAPAEDEDPPAPAAQPAPPPSGRLHRHREDIKRRYEGSSAEHLWKRLDAVDFINRGMLFAAVLLLCFFPFIIVLNALLGHSAVDGLVRHLGLNRQAAKDVSQLFASSGTTSNAISGLSGAFFVLGGIAGATAIQELYERAFGLESRGMRDVPRRLVWLGALIGLSVLSNWAGPHLHASAGPVALALVGLVVATAFWWFTMWVLLGNRVHGRALFSSAVATAVCWIGMQVVFSLIFSSTVISDNREYGPIGVIFALMTWLIAIGVVIILGAVIGVVWRERGMSFGAAFRRLRRRRAARGGE